MINLYPDKRNLTECATIVNAMEQKDVFACVTLWKQAAYDGHKYNLTAQDLFFMQACYVVYNPFVSLSGVVSVSCLFHFFVNGTNKESIDSHLGLQTRRCHARKEGWDNPFLLLRYDYYNHLVTVVIPALLFKSLYKGACPRYVNDNKESIHRAIVRHWELISGIAARGKPSELAPLYVAFKTDLNNALKIPPFKGDYLNKPLKGIGKLAYAIHRGKCIMLDVT